MIESRLGCERSGSMLQSGPMFSGKTNSNGVPPAAVNQRIRVGLALTIFCHRQHNSVAKALDGHLNDQNAFCLRTQSTFFARQEQQHGVGRTYSTLRRCI